MPQDNLSGKGSVPGSQKIIKNAVKVGASLSGDMYNSSIGSNPRLPGNPAKGTLGNSESVKSGASRSGGSY